MSDEKNPFDDMVNAAQKMAQALNPSLASLSSKEFEAFIPQMPKEVTSVARLINMQKVFFRNGD